MAVAAGDPCRSDDAPVRTAGDRTGFNLKAIDMDQCGAL
jgi:hypothetical protein